MKKQRGKQKKNIEKIEDSIISNIYNIIGEIYSIINENHSNINREKPNTENITMNIARNQNYSIGNTRSPIQSISDANADDSNIVLTTGSQLYPGTSFTNQSHAYRLRQHENQVNNRMRGQLQRQRLNNILNRYRSLSRPRNSSHQPVTRSIYNNRSNHSSIPRNINRSNPNTINSLAMAA